MVATWPLKFKVKEVNNGNSFEGWEKPTNGKSMKVKVTTHQQLKMQASQF